MSNNCEFCFEKEKNCICQWGECADCKKRLSLNWGDAYEYRGFIFCGDCFEEGRKKVEEKRRLVIEVTEKSIRSQREAEFKNNHHKYNINNVASDGLPIIEIKEPQILQEYEKGKL